MCTAEQSMCTAEQTMCTAEQTAHGLCRVWKVCAVV
jgi:hypothetical protein